MAAERGASRLEQSKCHCCLQEGRSEETEAGHHHLSSWEDDGENTLGKHFQTHEGQEGNREQSAWICREEIMLAKPDGLLPGLEGCDQWHKVSLEVSH